jgi:Uma2 family endonuclease
MNATVASPWITTEEMLALPEDDGIDRELIRGELREEPMTKRNRWHSAVEARLAKLLGIWLDSRPEPRGQILSGEAGVRLRRNPDTTVGIDVTWVSAEALAATPAEAPFVEGPPILAVEILSPSDTMQKLWDRVLEYLDVRVPLVWIVDPVLHTVTVYRPDAKVQLFHDEQELTGEPHLPGFRVAVADLFKP